MREGLLSKTYFIILCAYVFFIPQFYLEEGNKLNMFYYLLYYGLVFFSIIKLFFQVYTWEIVPSLVNNRSIIAFLAFLFISLASFFWSEANDPGIAAFSLFKSLLIIIPLLFLNTENDQLEKLFKFYYLGSILGSIQIIYNYYFKAEYLWGIKRSYLTGVDSNESAIFIAIGFSLALFYYFKSKNIWYLFSCFPQVVAVFYTGSRTGFVAIFIAAIMTLFYFKVLKFNFKSILLILSFILILFLLPYIVPSENVERIFQTTQDLSSGEMSGRTRIWSEAIRLIPDKLFYGYGMNSFSDILEKHYMAFNAHNVFLKAQFELGIIGSLLLLIWLYIYFRKLSVNRSEYKSFFVVSFVIILISFMQLSWIYSVNLLVMVSLLLNSIGNIDTQADVSKTK
jgi:O-antigen ligase